VIDMSKDEATLVALKQKFQRNINCLTDDDRSTRKRSLEKLKRSLLGGKPPEGATPKVLAAFFSQCLQQPLLNLLSDSVEKCRELSCEMLTVFARSVLEDVPSLLKDSVPVLKSRLGVVPFVEPAEEMRLVLLQFLSTMLKRESCWSVVPDLMEDICAIVGCSLTDAFPDVKKECTSCVTYLTKSAPADVRSHAPVLAKALIGNVAHQHSKVRQYTIQALGLLLPCIGAEGIEKLLKDVLLIPLNKIIYDGSPTVRKEFVKMLTYCLRNIESVEQFHSDLLPLLLAGLGDDNPDVQKLALSNVEAYGAEWYATQGEGAAGADEASMFDFSTIDLPAPFEERPGVGARKMLQKVLRLMLPPILEKTADWTAQTRSKAAALLRTVLVFVEDAVAVHLEATLTALAASCRDDEEIVADNVFHCAVLVGSYVEPGPIFESLLPKAQGVLAGMDTPEHRTAALVLMSGCIQGMSQAALSPHLLTVSETLAQKGLRECAVPELQDQLVCVVVDILGTAEEQAASREIAMNLVWVLLQLVASTDDGSDANMQAMEGLEQLAELSSLPSHESLCEVHFPKILEQMLPSEAADNTVEFPWKNKSPPCLLFDAMIRNGGKAVATHIEHFVPTLMAHLTPSNEPELRLYFLAMLETALGDASLNQAFIPHMPDLLLEAVMPNCVWRAGRVASTVRKVTIACLYTLLKQGLANQQCLFKTAAQILPVLKGSLDDTDANTRHLTCLCFQHLFLALPGALSEEPVRQLYPEFLKRLDDSNDTVRRSVCLTFTSFFKAAPPQHFQGTVLDYTLDCLYVHLDDSDRIIQDAVFDVLKVTLVINRDLVLKKASEVRTRHRSPEYCDKILAL